MRIIYVGDVVGRAGRTVLTDNLPGLREKLRLDAVVVNGENAAGGFGITAAICKEFFDAGADAITLGNHSWDQREMIGFIDGEPRLVRPMNMQPGTPGRGLTEVRTARGKRLVVAQVMGRLFMGSYDDPFRALEAELARNILGGNADAILVDIHAEATSEKMALGHFLDGRASLVAGTHTHVPTADAQILPGGTGYITDLGMTGDYDSVIGMEKEGALARFRSDIPQRRLEPALGEATLCAVYVETDDRTGLARRIEPVRLGGRLTALMPEAG
ncbi:TIGR00282 family metallophosphoesterase [Geminicoccaceae bacterium 1502E]|nr:TIGR00282 family metallophosphoesterase [Geminicoccaceae bacterium 1502E]